MLYDRLYKAQRSNTTPAPKFPFPSVNVFPLQPVSKLTPSEPKPSSNPATTRLTSEAINPYNTAPVQPGGPAISQPGFVNRHVPTNPPVTQPMYNPMAYHGGLYNPAGVVPSVPPQAPPPTQPVGPYNTDTAASWNDPPTLKARKVSACVATFL